MRVAYECKDDPRLPLVAAAPIRIELDAHELESVEPHYDALTQETVGPTASSLCNIDESVGAPFNSSSDMKQDD